jgi:hypothetical protein
MQQPRPDRPAPRSTLTIVPDAPMVAEAYSPSPSPAAHSVSSGVGRGNSSSAGAGSSGGAVANAAASSGGSGNGQAHDGNSPNGNGQSSVRAYIASPLNAPKTPTDTQFHSPDIDSPHVQLEAEGDVHILPPYLSEKYLLGPILGQGSYAFVREGTDKATGQKVAVKILNRSQVKPTAEVSIRREVYILGLLSHPNIVRTFAFYEEPSYFYTVLECITGGALFDRLKLRTVFTEFQVRELALVLLSAIQHCHERNVVHR